MQALIFRTTDERRELQAIIDGLGSTPEQLALFQARMAAERAEAESARGMSHAARLERALASIDRPAR